MTFLMSSPNRPSTPQSQAALLAPSHRPACVTRACGRDVSRVVRARLQSLVLEAGGSVWKQRIEAILHTRLQCVCFHLQSLGMAAEGGAGRGAKERAGRNLRSGKPSAASKKTAEEVDGATAPRPLPPPRAIKPLPEGYV